MREAYVATSTSRAWEEARDPVLSIYKEYLDWGHMQDEEGKPVPPGNEKALDDALHQRFMIGDPDFCVQYIEKLQADLGVNNIVMRMKFPGLAHDKVMASIRLFAEKVMPHFVE
jgi:alkanesulfonate monooxygenase SsuD/methylene tetrahydromethanopterin reductase-like flavin-dependent oxidoreductase (luciferase family)